MIYQFTEPPLGNNNYLIFDEESREAALIDCSDTDTAIVEKLEQNNLHLKYILLTHAHFDHIGAVCFFKEKYQPTVCLNEADCALMAQLNQWQHQMGFPETDIPTVDLRINENTDLKLGTKSIRVITTPGHTPGGVCYLYEDYLFSGDTLFRGAYGRIDLPGSSATDMKNSLKKLSALPTPLTVYPGHGSPTTIGSEQNNIQKYLQFDFRQ